MGSLTRLVDAVRVATHSARRGANSMRLTSRLTWFVAIAVLGYAASPADAQTAPAPPPPSGGTGGAGFDTQVGFQQRVNISPEDQVATFNAHLAYAAQARDTVQTQL